MQTRADMLNAPNDPVIIPDREMIVTLRTTLPKNIKRAGLAPWPKLWQKTRASRGTELVERFQRHVVAK